MTIPTPLALRSSPSLTIVGSAYDNSSLADFVGIGKIQLTIDNITAIIPYLHGPLPLSSLLSPVFFNPT
jgi:hypothetical protein